MESVTGTDHTRASLPGSAIQILCSISGHEHSLPRQITTTGSIYPAEAAGLVWAKALTPREESREGCIPWGLSPSPSWKINLHTAVVNQGYITSLPASPCRLQRGTAPSSGCLPQDGRRWLTHLQAGTRVSWSSQYTNALEDSGTVAPRSSRPRPNCASSQDCSISPGSRTMVGKGDVGFLKASHVLI